MRELLDRPVTGCRRLDGVEGELTIGQLARQVGVSARTIRFWADEGLIDCGRSASGYRMFGPQAAVAASLLAVLRELGVDLATIRALLEGGLDLARVLTAHAVALDARIAQLRFQRSVVRAVAAVGRPTVEELRTMNELANLTRDERQRIIADLVEETFAGVGATVVADKMLEGAPDLPDDPSPEQVAAWVELVGLVRDPAFRARMRQMAEAGDAPSEAGEHDVDGPALATAVSAHAEPARAAGSDPTSAEAAAVVSRVLADAGAPVADRRAFADQLAIFSDHRVERYWQLVATINGWEPLPAQVPAFDWFIDALRAP